MPTQYITTTNAPDARFCTLCTSLSCPPLPKKRVIDLPFEEEGDSALLLQIMSGMPVSIPRSMVPPVCIPLHTPAPTPVHPSPHPPSPSRPIASGVIIPAHMSAQIVLSRHMQADVSSPPPRRQSPSPPRATRRDREGRRSPSRSSTVSFFEYISVSSTTGAPFDTRRRTSDSSLSSSSSSHSTQLRY